MNYIEWSKEYFIQAENIKRMVVKLKTEKKNANPDLLREYDRRITILYSMYLECKHTGELLYSRAGV